MNDALINWVKCHFEKLEKKGIIAKVVYDENMDGGYSVSLDSENFVGHILYWPKRTEINDTYEVEIEDISSDKRILLEKMSFEEKKFLENYLDDLFFRRIDSLIPA